MADFGEVVELNRDERDVLMHAVRRHLRISRVPLSREQVATLVGAGLAGIPIHGNIEDDWFFTNTGLKTAAALGFLRDDAEPAASTTPASVPEDSASGEP